MHLKILLKTKIDIFNFFRFLNFSYYKIAFQEESK